MNELSQPGIVRRGNLCRQNELLLLLLILTLGFDLRIARSGFESLVFDEVWHMELSVGRGSVHSESVLVPNNTFVVKAPSVTSLQDAPPWYSIWTLTGPAPASLVRQFPGKTAWLVVPMEFKDISSVLPGATEIERTDFPADHTEAACIHVSLPAME